MADALVSLPEGGLLAKDRTKFKHRHKATRGASDRGTNDVHDIPDHTSATNDIDVTNDFDIGDDFDIGESSDAGNERVSGDDVNSGGGLPAQPVERLKLITPWKVKPSVVINFNVEKWEAELLGTGPIPITPSLLDLASNDLYYAFKNMKGEVLKLGRAQYEPTAVQKLAVMARDRHCMYPDCTVTAGLCEIHHINEWLIDQGFTDVEVLGLFCRQHHHHLHTANLTARRQPDGTVAIYDRTNGQLIAKATPLVCVAA